MMYAEKETTLAIDLSSGRIAQKIASELNKEIKDSLYMTDGIKNINLKSIIGILSSGFTFNDKVTIVAIGTDKEEAETSLERAVNILSKI